MTRLSSALLAAVLSLTACGGGISGGGEAGVSGRAKPKAAEEGPLEGVRIVVGSKDFGEQVVLGQMTIALLSEAGADVVDKTNLKGTVNTRRALMSGEIDLYWEYTGTGWVTLLGHTEPVQGAEAQYEAVAEEDLAENGIAWSTPLELNNTYAFSMLAERAEELGVTKLSDLASLEPADLTFCIESEFSTRDDGMPGMVEAYGLDVPDGNISHLDGGVIYVETQKAEICNFGEVFATAGHLDRMGLVLLEDDLEFFPVYQPALTAKAELIEEHPEIFEIAETLAPLITTDEIRRLNEAVEVDAEDPVEIARTWLEENGLL